MIVIEQKATILVLHFRVVINNFMRLQISSGASSDLQTE